MAILRGGRRIGNYDIRVGLPRDRSLVDVEKDPRLKRQPGGSGQIQRFQSQINQGEGFAAPNRYLIVNLLSSKINFRISFIFVFFDFLMLDFIFKYLKKLIKKKCNLAAKFLE